MGKIALYIHWPYCMRLCPYCDFNIYKNRPANEMVLVDAILKDMRNWRQMSGPRQLISIHFGGGTPSLMAPHSLADLIATAQNLWTPKSDLEIGLEANPNDIDKTRLVDWREAGIERLSIGVQSFDDEALAFIGRNHDSGQAQRALEYANNAMPRVSLDLIYGMARQNPTIVERDIDTAISSGVGHISTYQLTIESKTAFGRALMRGDNKAVLTDESADAFERMMDRLNKAGFDQYEVSNFANTKTEQSRHNLAYWQGVDYIGVGPGAHGRLSQESGRLATIAALNPNAYIDSVQENGHGIVEREHLDGRACAEEYVLMGMRIRDGIDLRKFRALAGEDIDLGALDQLINLGLIIKQSERIYASQAGRLVLDAVSHQLLS